MWQIELQRTDGTWERLKHRYSCRETARAYMRAVKVYFHVFHGRTVRV